ncbi:MAG TPA: insulinase family protein, partial [Micromonospora sp.]
MVEEAPHRAEAGRTSRALPPLGPNRKLKLPPQAERTLPNGLTVIAIRRPAVPLVEVRLWVPFAGAHLARAALLRRMFGRHPYAVQTPTPEQVGAVRPGALRTLHADRVRPDGSVLVLVGEVHPERALDAAEAALGGWTGAGGAVEPPATPPLEPGPLVLVDRPGSVQSSLRLALPAVPRTHPDHVPLQLANLIFGGYFSSRWVENIREDKGYTYGPYSAVEHFVAGSVLTVSAEVATEVTGPALLETVYELGRLASLPPKEDELEQARQYALGSLQLGMSTQAGLAALASGYAGVGLRLDFLAGYAAQLARVTRD